MTQGFRRLTPTVGMCILVTSCGISFFLKKRRGYCWRYLRLRMMEVASCKHALCIFGTVWGLSLVRLRAERCCLRLVKVSMSSFSVLVILYIIVGGI